MRKILLISLMVYVTGCATPVRQVVESPAQPKPAPVEPTVAPLNATAPATPVLLPPAAAAPREAAAVPRKLVGPEEFAEANDEKLLNVYVGMSRLSVERIMDGHQSGKWINPYKHQVVVDADGKKNEILFYLTRAPRTGQRITESLLTPVIFQDDRVTAIGRYPLKKLRRSACLSRAQGHCP